MIAKENAHKLIRKLGKRNRRKLQVLCLPMGLGIAEIGMVCWVVSKGDPNVLVMIPLAVIPAALLSIPFALLAMLVIPEGLERKKPDSASRRLFVSTCVVMGAITIATGYFPFLTAGIVMCATTLWLMIRMPDEPFPWLSTQCVGCAYDLTASEGLQCPECGLSELDLRNADRNGTTRRTTRLRMTWVVAMLALWVGTAVWFLLNPMVYR